MGHNAEPAEPSAALLPEDVVAVWQQFLGVETGAKIWLTARGSGAVRGTFDSLLLTDNGVAAIRVLVEPRPDPVPGTALANLHEPRIVVFPWHSVISLWAAE